MDKILFVATIDQHIRHFHYPFLEWFKSKDYEVHVASNGEEKLLHVDKKYDIPFERSPLKSNNIKAYKQLKNLIESNDYKLIHCHTPMGGAIARLASITARKKGLKVLYTAHGFHFYKGASKMNWLLYYPVEKILSRFTDVLITINEEDYELANSRHFKSHKIELVKGVGVNFNKFSPKNIETKQKIRRNYSYSDEAFILIYVGELSYRKHQDLLITAVSIAKDDIPNLKLLLVGEGDLYDDYKKLIASLGVEANVELLGYRSDVPNLMSLADVAVSSSRQEGLPVNVIEAMATGLPLVVSNSRGNRDLVINGENGIIIDSDDANEMSNAILKLHKSEELRQQYGEKSLIMVNNYSIDNILKEMTNLYLDLL